MAVRDLMHLLEEAIEILRGQMCRAAEARGRVSSEVLTLSQELDQMLNLYERLKGLPRFLK
jgi:hypothetical protein